MAMARNNGEMVSVVVSVDDEHLRSMEGVVEELQAAGLRIEETMEGLGTVAGSIEPSKLESLTHVQGVAGVEESQTFHLPPPESDVQ
jgi:methylmalonyl-CoA mutase cobalamin-binding subunit